MSVWLVLTTKVQVNIGNFISLNPKNVSNGMSCPSLISSAPQVLHCLSGKSNPEPTDPSSKNSLVLQLDKCNEVAMD